MEDSNDVVLGGTRDQVAGIASCLPLESLRNNHLVALHTVNGAMVVTMGRGGSHAHSGCLLPVLGSCGRWRACILSEWHGQDVHRRRNIQSADVRSSCLFWLAHLQGGLLRYLSSSMMLSVGMMLLQLRQTLEPAHLQGYWSQKKHCPYLDGVSVACSSCICFTQASSSIPRQIRQGSAGTIQGTETVFSSFFFRM